MVYTEGGSYIGNGGRLFIPTGFRPAFVAVQRYDFPQNLVVGTPVGTAQFDDSESFATFIVRSP